MKRLKLLLIAGLILVPRLGVAESNDPIPPVQSNTPPPVRDGFEDGFKSMSEQLSTLDQEKEEDASLYLQPGFFFGIASSSSPALPIYEKNAQENLYVLGSTLGFEHEVMNVAVYFGGRASFYYPARVSLRDGQPSFHLTVAPRVSTGFTLADNEKLRLRMTPFFDIIYKKMQYPVGSINYFSPSVGAEIGIDLLGFRISSDWYPVVKGSGYYGLPVFDYHRDGEFEALEQLTGEESTLTVVSRNFRQKGGLQAAGAQFELGVGYTHKEGRDRGSFVFGYEWESRTYDGLHQVYNYSGTTLTGIDELTRKLDAHIFYLKWQRER